VIIYSGFHIRTGAGYVNGLSAICNLLVLTENQFVNKALQLHEDQLVDMLWLWISQGQWMGDFMAKSPKGW
jgi:hypothetical protein